MRSFPAKCVFFLFAAVSAFSQSGAVREQGLVTSEPFWRQALGGAVMSLPHVQAQSAVVALDGGNIRAYSTSGTPMWNYSARGRISPFVTRSREGTSYFSRTNGILIALNRTGRELWRRNIGDPLCAAVIVGWDGRLFVPTDKKISCYTASGNLLWTRVFEEPFSLAPKPDRSGGIIFALGNNEVYRSDPFGNTSAWLLSGAPSVLIPIERQQIMALYADGTMEILGVSGDWYISAQSDVRFQNLPGLPSPPLAAVSRDGNAAVTLNDGRVVLVSTEQGSILWTGNSHIREMINNGGRPETEVEMLFNESGIYVLSKNGATCFSHNGMRLWFTFLQNAAAIPAFGDDGVLYSGGRDWILYAYRIEDRPLPERGIFYGADPEGSYGTGHPMSIYLPVIPYSESDTRGMLEQIGTAVSAGRVGSDEPAWTTFLLTLCAGQESIIYRIGALNLLGKIGSRETIPWLVNIFRRDSEPSIKAAAITAIGDIGVDPQGTALQAFLYSITHSGGIRDEQVLTAIAQATGALCRFSGPPLSQSGIMILNLLSTASQPPVVRRQAGRELASLR